MKTFVIACVVFALLVLFLFGSSAYLSRELSLLEKEAEVLGDLPMDRRAAAAGALVEKWEKKRLLFVIFVHEEELVPLEGALTRARAAAEIKSDSDFQIAVAEVCAAFASLEYQVGTHIASIV